MSERLAQLYDEERKRLLALSEADNPAGGYAHPVFGAGSQTSGLMLVGEAPGAEETKLGLPFVGKAGKQLSTLLERMGLTREELYLTNTVKYRPVTRSERSVRNRTPDKNEIAASLPLLEQEIASIGPDYIATLGNTPLRAVLCLAGEQEKTIGLLHGQLLPLTIGGVSFTLCPLYHPASGIYNPKMIPVMEADAARFGEHLVKQGGSNPIFSKL